MEGVGTVGETENLSKVQILKNGKYLVCEFYLKRSPEYYMDNIQDRDQIREVLNNILELTRKLVLNYKRQGRPDLGTELILWVCTCLHHIMVEKRKIFFTSRFSPRNIRRNYYSLLDNCLLYTSPSPRD